MHSQQNMKFRFIEHTKPSHVPCKSRR